jgi:hypothetical protein
MVNTQLFLFSGFHAAIFPEPYDRVFFLQMTGASESWLILLRREAQDAKVFATFLRLPKVELNLLIQPTF